VLRELRDLAAALGGQGGGPAAPKRWILELSFAHEGAGRSIDVEIDTHELRTHALCRRAGADSALARELAEQDLTPVTRDGLPGLRAPTRAFFAWGESGVVALALRDGESEGQTGARDPAAVQSFLDGVRLKRIAAFFSRP